MFRSEGAGVLRPKRAFVTVGAILVALIPVIATVALVTRIYPIAAALIHATLFGSMALNYGFRSTTGAKIDAGTLRVDEHTVSVDGRVVAERADLEAAFIVPTEGAALVHLQRKGRFSPPVFVRVRDELEAEGLLRELGFDAEHTAAQMRIASGLLAMSVWKQTVSMMAPLLAFVPAMIAFGAAHNPAGSMASVATLLAYVFGLSFTPTTVRVGTDGIVTRWLGRTRFISHADIVRTETYGEAMGGKTQRGVRLYLKSGEAVRLPTGQTDIAKVEAKRLEHRIDEARLAHRRGAVGGTTELLARGDRTLADWIRYLRGMGAGAVGPRAPAVPSDVLLRIVEDSRAAPLDRASAAVAAIASGDDDVKRRVRVAADTTASPKLRVALERIATGDDEELALAESLDELNAEREAS